MKACRTNSWENYENTTLINNFNPHKTWSLNFECVEELAVKPQAGWTAIPTKCHVTVLQLSWTRWHVSPNLWRWSSILWFWRKSMNTVTRDFMCPAWGTDISPHTVTHRTETHLTNLPRVVLFSCKGSPSKSAPKFLVAPSPQGKDAVDKRPCPCTLHLDFNFSKSEAQILSEWRS